MSRARSHGAARVIRPAAIVAVPLAALGIASRWLFDARRPDLGHDRVGGRDELARDALVRCGSTTCRGSPGQTDYPIRPISGGYPLLQVWITQGWGAFGWLEVKLAAGVYRVLGVITVVIGAGAGAALWRAPPRDRLARGELPGARVPGAARGPALDRLPPARGRVPRLHAGALPVPGDRGRSAPRLRPRCRSCRRACGRRSPAARSPRCSSSTCSRSVSCWSGSMRKRALVGFVAVLAVGLVAVVARRAHARLEPRVLARRRRRPGTSSTVAPGSVACQGPIAVPDGAAFDRVTFSPSTFGKPGPELAVEVRRGGQRAAARRAARSPPATRTSRRPREQVVARRPRRDASAARDLPAPTRARGRVGIYGQPGIASPRTAATLDGTKIAGRHGDHARTGEAVAPRAAADDRRARVACSAPAGSARSRTWCSPCSS